MNVESISFRHTFRAFDLTSAALKDAQNTAMNMASFYAKQRDLILRGKILLLEGHRPSDEEIKKHARRMIYPDGKVEWAWKGTVIMIEPVPDFDIDKPFRKIFLA